jgi:hypothetical protein
MIGCRPAVETGVQLLHGAAQNFHKQPHQSIFAYIYNYFQSIKIDKNISICDNLFPNLKRSIGQLSPDAMCYAEKDQLLRHIAIECN